MQAELFTVRGEKGGARQSSQWEREGWCVCAVGPKQREWTAAYGQVHELLPRFTLHDGESRTCSLSLQGNVKVMRTPQPWKRRQVYYPQTLIEKNLESLDAARGKRKSVGERQKRRKEGKCPDRLVTSLLFKKSLSDVYTTRTDRSWLSHHRSLGYLLSE